jgi:hypothetical protein
VDRTERDALAWANTKLQQWGVSKQFEQLPKGKPGDPALFPVARVISRGLEVGGLRTPGPTNFDATVTTYRFWQALRLSETFWPPGVIEFNRAFKRGEYPHLL